MPQKLIAMGLRVFLLVCVINTVSAAGFSQGKKLDVDFTNSTIGAVLDYLKEKAGYDFVYRKGVVRVDDVVTLKLKKFWMPCCGRMGTTTRWWIR